MKIQITGISGFVGANLSKYLIESGACVQELSLRNKHWETKIDQEALALIHLAAKAHDTSNSVLEEEYFEVNRDLTIALFEQFLTSEMRDFFYFSSVKAAADILDCALVEDIDANPLTVYGKSKLAAEQYLLSHTLPEGKRLFIIRPCMIHGPGNKGNLNLLYQVVEKGIPWPLAAFHNERSFLSIDNLNYMMKRLIEDVSIPSGVYNFADDDTLSTNEVVSLINDTLGKPARLWRIPVSFVKLGVKVGDLFNFPLNSERLKKLTESYIVSNSKIKAVLRIEKLPLSAKEGLERSIKSFRVKY